VLTLDLEPACEIVELIVRPDVERPRREFVLVAAFSDETNAMLPGAKRIALGAGAVKRVLTIANEILVEHGGDARPGLSTCAFRTGAPRWNEAAVSSGSVLWCDADNEASARLVREFTDPPADVVVASRQPGRVHGYWKLPSVLDLRDEEARARYKAALRRLQSATRSDPTSSLTRMMRLPCRDEE
jgi:hypothetical protein